MAGSDVKIIRRERVEALGLSLRDMPRPTTPSVPTVVPPPVVAQMDITPIENLQYRMKDLQLALLSGASRITVNRHYADVGLAVDLLSEELGGDRKDFGLLAQFRCSEAIFFDDNASNNQLQTAVDAFSTFLQTSHQLRERVR